MSARDEAAIADRAAVLDVLNSGRALPLDVVSAQIIMVLTDRGFRRQGPITDAQVEAAGRSLAGLSFRLWEQAKDDELANLDYYRDQARAALEAARAAS